MLNWVHYITLITYYPKGQGTNDVEIVKTGNNIFLNNIAPY